MKYGRYKNFNWEQSYKNRRERMARLIELRAPEVIIEMNARLLLESCHRGPWRSIWASITNELHDVYMWYGWHRWEWVRVHVLRLPRDPTLAELERLDEEDAAIEELSKQL